MRTARLSKPSTALTASATKVDSSNSGGLRRLHQGWQPQALGFYDRLGECWYPAQFYARSMERIRFYPALPDTNGEPKEVDSGPLRDLFDMIRDPSGGINELAGSYGRLQWVIGDGYLTVTEQDGAELWEFLSPLELRVQPATGDQRQEYRRLTAPGATPEELVEAGADDFAPLSGNNARVYRLHRRHPTYSQWSDAPVRAVLEPYELLLKLTLAAGSESTSRAAQQGMLYVPDELSFPTLNPADDEDPEADGFMERLEQAFARAIREPGSAAASMPLVLRGPALLEGASGKVTMADAIKWIQLGPGEHYPESKVWADTVTRIANGLDLPVEMVAGGISGANHWGGWLLDEQGFRVHVAPEVVKFCNDLNAAYLRPAAAAANIERAGEVMIWFDPVEAIAHPDESTVAKDAFDRFAISWETYRDRTGFTEDDAPDELELQKRIDIAIRRRALIPAGEETATPPAGGETSPAAGGTGSDTAEEPPAAAAAQTASARDLRTARILGAADIALERAREVAGSRIARRSQSCPECMERIHGVPRNLVAATLGAEQVRTVLDGHGGENDLVAGAGKVLADMLEAWGINGGWPEKLADMVEQHALRTLYEPRAPRLPPGFEAACTKAAQ